MLIRKAQRSDVPAMLGLVKELAVYEKEPDAVRVTESEMEREGFDNHLFTAYVAEVDEIVVGFALWYPRYSTWNGRTMHLEDFYVKPEFRGLKIGKALFQVFLKSSKEWGAKQVKWEVLDWNQPAIDFYNRYPTELTDGWLLARIDDTQLDKIVE